MLLLNLLNFAQFAKILAILWKNWSGNSEPSTQCENSLSWRNGFRLCSGSLGSLGRTHRRGAVVFSIHRRCWLSVRNTGAGEACAEVAVLGWQDGCKTTLLSGKSNIGGRGHVRWFPRFSPWKVRVCHRRRRFVCRWHQDSKVHSRLQHAASGAIRHANSFENSVHALAISLYQDYACRNG